MRSEEDDEHGVPWLERSYRDDSTGHIICSRQRKCHPEKLFDTSRRVRELGTAFFDNGAAISRTLAAIVSS